jgi:PAS domain S-box-containing protein
MVDASGKLEVTWIAGAFEEISGYTVEEYKAKGGWRSILHPDDVAKDKQDMADLQKNKMVITEIRTLKKSGEISWVKVYAHPVWDKKNNCLIGVYGAVQDITERKKTEINLSASEERFRILIEQAADGIFLGDPDGNFIGVNTSGVEMTGYGKDELMKMNMSDLFTEDEKKKVPLRYDLLREGLVVINERALKRKDGSIRQVEMHTKMMPDKTYQSIFRDITDRKKSQIALQESEEKYRLIFEYSPVGLLSFDKNGTILACNDNFVKIIGSSREKLVGLNMLNLPDKNIVAVVQKALNGSPGLYEGVYSSVTAQKETPARCLFAPVSIDGNIGGVGIIEDITERKLIEDRIRKINEELEELVKERTLELENTNVDLQKEIVERTKAEEYIKHQLEEREVLLKEIHHRVKNNMQIIISILNLQASFIKNKKIVNILQDSQNRVKTMALIHEKLYQSKDFSNINFSEYITNLLKYLFTSYQSPEQQIEYKINIESFAMDMDTIISLGLVTNELVSNSFKYAFAGEVNCMIDISLKKHDDQNLVMIIKDNGKGLPPGFDYKHTESLGLQLVCLLTEQIQGKLEVESSDNGTIFSIIFPSSNK